jgi:hypothetical protein
MFSSIATNASNIDFDTLSASNAVKTRYIIPIIFCLGVSFPPAMILCFSGLYQGNEEKIKK